MKEVYLSGGCFWSMQKFFECVAGVKRTQAGFVNGYTERPTYMQVVTGKTGFAKAVLVEFEESLIPLTGILELYMMAMDPRTTDTSQPQHRAGVYYTDLGDEEAVTRILAGAKNSFPWVGEINVEPLRNYYPAEEYHQHYLEKHPSGHCNISKGAFIYAGEYKV